MRSMQLSDVATYVGSVMKETDVNLGRAHRAAKECYLAGRNFKRVDFGDAKAFVLLQDLDTILDEIAFNYGDRMHTAFRMERDSNGERLYRAPWNCDHWLAAVKDDEIIAISIFAVLRFLRSRLDRRTPLRTTLWELWRHRSRLQHPDCSSIP